jgi:hypothetical protein
MVDLSGSITQWESSASLPMDPLRLSVLLVRKGLHVNGLQQMKWRLGVQVTPTHRQEIGPSTTAK